MNLCTYTNDNQYYELWFKNNKRRNKYLKKLNPYFSYKYKQELENFWKNFHKKIVRMALEDKI